MEALAASSIGVWLHGCAVAIVSWHCRRRILANGGAVFVFMSAIVHGLTEVVQAAFPTHAYYRNLVGQAELEEWLLISGVANLVFAGAYVLTRRIDARRATTPSLAAAENSPPWQPAAALAVAGVVFAGFKESGNPTAAYWIDVLLSQLWILAAVMAGFLLQVRLRGRFLVPMVIALAAGAAVLTSRTMVLVTCLGLVGTMQRHRLRLPVRALAIAGGLLVVLTALISSARAVVGREQLRRTLSERVDGLRDGGGELLKAGALEGLLTDFVYRFDGNAFPGLVTLQFEHGREPVGLTPIAIDLFLLIPSVLYPDKLSSDDIMRNESAFIIWKLSLPANVPFLPSTYGVIYACLGTVGLLASMLGGGFMFARGDRYAEGGISTSRVLVGIILLVTPYAMDVGMVFYFLNARTALLLFVLTKLWPQRHPRRALGAGVHSPPPRAKLT